ncbi:unnamed protein product [Sphagnum balticum]
MLLSSMVFLSPVRNERCTPASIAPNARCLEGALLVFDSGYPGVCILVADDHLPGMLPACKTSNHFEGFSGDGLCMSWIEPPSIRPIFETEEFQILFLMMQDFRVLDSLSLGIFG